MVESEAKQLSEEQMLGAVVFGHEQMQTAIDAICKLLKGQEGRVELDPKRLMNLCRRECRTLLPAHLRKLISCVTSRNVLQKSNKFMQILLSKLELVILAKRMRAPLMKT